MDDLTLLCCTKYAHTHTHARTHTRTHAYTTIFYDHLVAPLFFLHYFLLILASFRRITKVFVSSPKQSHLVFLGLCKPPSSHGLNHHSSLDPINITLLSARSIQADIVMSLGNIFRYSQRQLSTEGSI